MVSKRPWLKRIFIRTFSRYSVSLQNRLLGFSLLALVGLMTVLSLPVLPVLASANWQVGISEMGKVAATVEVQRGKELYQTGRFLEAATVWQQAAATFAVRDDKLNQALVLSYLASSFEQIGQWPQANAAIADSLNLLNSAPRTSHSATIEGQTLNTQGHLQFAQGRESEALATWQRAEVAYRRAGDAVGIAGSQINQAKALQNLGLYRRAKAILEQVEQTVQKQPDSTLKIAGWRNLGNALRMVGNLTQSQQVLQQSLAVAERLRDAKLSSSDELPSEMSATLLSLANTARAQGETDTALSFYRQAAAVAVLPTAKIQPQVNQLSLLVETGQWAVAQTLWPQIQSQLAALPPSRLAIYAQTNFAQSLMKMGSGRVGENRQNLTPSPPLQSISAQVLATAVQQAESLSDARAESYSLGMLGSLYEQTQQWDNARDLTQQALTLAQTINAPDIAYQWQWQLGRLLSARGDIKGAIAAYTEAIQALGAIRNDLVATNQEVQFSFRESVEPVYRQLVGLLLQPSKTEPSQKDLKKARDVIESLQLAELNNFFLETCLNARPVAVDSVNPQTAVIYPIILPDQLAIILSLPNQPLSYYSTALPQSEVERNLDQMRQSLRRTSFLEERLTMAKQVYDLLLRPAEAKLATSSITTLVFVLDGSLRSLPMAALYDGQKYLLEKYSIALTPSLQLLAPQPLAPKQLKGLLGGLSQASQGFPALPGVAVEIEQIKSEISAQVLLDREFTSTTLQGRIDAVPFSVVHLATHSQFSSKAENTFILTWNGRINVKQLDQILQAREQGVASPIELLVLSACQTAASDRRAALGLAGLAVRSGARSTLATLWSVNDQSTASLMAQFYQELAQARVTKAEALRRAQLALLKQPQFEHPYYWAPFILLGNWL